MAPPTYASPMAGLPPQIALHTGRAVFTEAYALIPHGVMRDIVTSYLPHWTDTRAWIIARPMTGFSETFSQYVVEVFPGGGSDRPEPEAGVEGVLFVLEGQATLTIGGKSHLLKPGGRLLAMKGMRPDEEIAALPAGWSLSALHALTVPGLVGERHLVIVARTDDLPSP